MNWELRISSEAERYIEEQMQWYEDDERHDGADLANRWLDTLENALAKFVKNPRRYGFAPENGRWHPELSICQFKFLPWKSKAGWRVLFVVEEDTHVLTVLQVRHERRSWLFEYL